MKSELWQRVETLFHQALEIDDDQREAWLQGAAEGDSELLREVQDLLSLSGSRQLYGRPCFRAGIAGVGH